MSGQARAMLLVCVAALVLVVSGTDPSLPPECVRSPDKACIRKCCPLGQNIVDKDCETSDLQLEVFYLNDTIPATPDSYVLVIGNPCKHGRYRLEPHLESSDEFFMLRNGSLVVPTLLPGGPLGPNDFCFETFFEEGEDEPLTLPLVCFQAPSKAYTPESAIHFIIYPIGLLISVPFLLATLIVYSMIPELRDLNGKSLVCYCSCMTVAYLALAIVQFGSSSFSHDCCKAFAFIVQYSFLACFFWLNVLSIDTFWSIMVATNSLSYYPGQRRWMWVEGNQAWVRMDSHDPTVEEDQERRVKDRQFSGKVFVLYSAYAWCLPFLFILLTVVMNYNPSFPSSYVNPGMGESNCWFSSEEASLTFFYGPIGCVLAINLVLFFITLYKIFTFNWNYRGPHRTPKQKARMSLLLFVVMGVGWVMEVVSWAVGGPTYVWTATDVFNILQGVIIFVIFVLEQRVKHLVNTNLLPRLRLISNEYCCHQRPSQTSRQTSVEGQENAVLRP